MQEVQPHSRHIFVHRGLTAPIRLGNPFARSASGVLIDAVRVYGLHAASARFWARDSPPDRHLHAVYEPPRDIRTFANSFVEYLEWFYRAARETTGLQHRRSEARYNKHLGDHLDTPDALVRVLQHGRHFGARVKLVAPFSALCEVLEVNGPVLKLRELDSQRVFTATHDAVHLSILRAPQKPLQDGEPPPVLVARPAAHKPRAASPPALIAAPPPATRPAADQRTRDATTFPPASQFFAFHSPSHHRKKTPN